MSQYNQNRSNQHPSTQGPSAQRRLDQVQSDQAQSEQDQFGQRQYSRHRLWLVVAILFGSAITVTLIMYALRANIDFFYTPSMVLYGKGEQQEKPRLGQHIQLGGMVLPGSVQRDPESLKITFVVYDNEAEMTVSYEGILPDLFSEGQSVVAQGILRTENHLEADKILAKHDENYTPPEIVDAMERNHQKPASAYQPSVNGANIK